MKRESQSQKTRLELATRTYALLETKMSEDQVIQEMAEKCNSAPETVLKWLPGAEPRKPPGDKVFHLLKKLYESLGAVEGDLREIGTKASSKNSSRKAPLKRHVIGPVHQEAAWNVVFGELKRRQGRPRQVDALFRCVAEKLPFSALGDVGKHIRETHFGMNGIDGVYVAHDSMGLARYVGRGKIFDRLKSLLKRHPNELLYFSFYVVQEKNHEREIETLLIRAAGPQLHFNDRKKRVDIQPGNVSDFEAGTFFYERKSPRGPKRKT